LFFKIRLDDYIKKYNQDKLPIPIEIEQSLRHILAKNTEGEITIWVKSAPIKR
jgi:hypothetical protein